MINSSLFSESVRLAERKDLVKPAGNPAGGLLLCFHCTSPQQWTGRVCEQHYSFSSPSLMSAMQYGSLILNWLIKCNNMSATPLSYMACGVAMVTNSWADWRLVLVVHC